MKFLSILDAEEAYSEYNKPEHVEAVSLMVKESDLVSWSDLCHILVVDDKVWEEDGNDNTPYRNLTESWTDDGNDLLTASTIEACKVRFLILCQ